MCLRDVALESVSERAGSTQLRYYSDTHTHTDEERSLDVRQHIRAHEVGGEQNPKQRLLPKLQYRAIRRRRPAIINSPMKTTSARSSFPHCEIYLEWTTNKFRPTLIYCGNVY